MYYTYVLLSEADRRLYPIVVNATWNLVEAAATSSSVWPARSLRLGTTSWNGT